MAGASRPRPARPDTNTPPTPAPLEPTPTMPDPAAPPLPPITPFRAFAAFALLYRFLTKALIAYTYGAPYRFRPSDGAYWGAIVFLVCMPRTMERDRDATPAWFFRAECARLVAVPLRFAAVATGLPALGILFYRLSFTAASLTRAPFQAYRLVASSTPLLPLAAGWPRVLWSHAMPVAGCAAAYGLAFVAVGVYARLPARWKAVIDNSTIDTWFWRAAPDYLAVMVGYGFLHAFIPRYHAYLNDTVYPLL